MNAREIAQINRTAGGSTLTRRGRESALMKIADDLRGRLNVQVKSFDQLKISHIEALAASWRGSGLSVRTCQNNMAHLRTALREIGREKFSADPRISNEALKINKGSRAGTHRAPARDDAIRRIESMKAGHGEAARLQLELGLRAREAIQSYKSLPSWGRELEKTGRITVTAGTKGGRARSVDLSNPEALGRAKEAIRQALTASGGGRKPLVASSSLEGAARSYQREMASVGFSGEQASHALRCAFAQDQYQRHLQQTGDRKEALRRLSLDLGHGDGRGVYCAQVYLKG
jgi:hypothetical protein